MQAFQWAAIMGSYLIWAGCKWGFSLIDWVTINLLKGSHPTHTLTSTRGNRMNLIGTLMWQSEFFNRWLVVDVPQGWQLVSQVLLAPLITPLRAEIIGRVGRVLFCQGALFFSPRTMSPTSGLRGFWPHTRGLFFYLAHAIASTVDVTFTHFLSLCRSFFSSLLWPIHT